MASSPDEASTSSYYTDASVVALPAASSRQNEVTSTAVSFAEWRRLTVAQGGQFEEAAFFVFEQSNCIRRAAVDIASSDAFETICQVAVVLHLVLLCLLQTAYDAQQQSSSAWRSTVVWAEIVVTWFGFFEILIMCVAHGCVLHPASYFRQAPYSRLVSLVALSISLAQVAPSLRTNAYIRCAKLLRTPTLFFRNASVSRVARGVGRAFPLWIVNLLLVAYLMAVFSVISVKSWQTALQRKCIVDLSGVLGANDTHHALLPDPVDVPCGYGYTCPGNVRFADDPYTTNGYLSSLAGNLSFAVSCASDAQLYERVNFNFDNVITGMLYFTRVVSLDNIQQAFDDVMAMSGKPFAVFIVLLVVLTSFMTVYLFLAILIDTFASDDLTVDRSGDHAVSSSLSNAASVGVGAGANHLKPESTTVVDVACQVSPLDPLATNDCELLPYVGITTSLAGTPNAAGLNTPRALGSTGSVPRLTTMRVVLKSDPAEDETTTTRIGGAGAGGEDLDGDVLTRPVRSSQELAVELGPWVRRFPLPFLDSVRRRGFWASFRELEHTTSYPCLSGAFAVNAALALNSNALAVWNALLTFGTCGCLCALSDGMDEDVKSSLLHCAMATSLWFALVVLCKVAVYGPRAALGDIWNVVDVVTAVVAACELGMPSVFAEYSLVCGLRTTRVLRVGKFFSPVERFTRVLFRSWRSSLASLGWCAGFFLWCAAVGMVLLGDSYSPAGPTSPRTQWDWKMQRDSFSTLWDSLLMSFIIVSGDRWTTRLDASISRIGDPAKEACLLLFFVSCFVLGNYLLLNVVTVLLVESSATTLREEEVEVEPDLPPLLLLPLGRPLMQKLLSSGAQQIGPLRSPRRRSLSGGTERKRSADQDAIVMSTLHTAAVEEQSGILPWLLHIEKYKAVGQSCGCLYAGDDVRRVCLSVVGSTLFRVVVVGALLANVLILLFTSAFNTVETVAALNLAAAVLLAIFWLEIIMKMVAFGVVFPAEPSDPTALHPHQAAFLRDPWNQLDFVVNSLCLAAIFVPSLRAAIALRTLRLASLTQQTRDVLSGMLRSLPPVLNALLITVYTTLIFGVLGVQLFQGRFYRCSDPTKIGPAACVGNVTVRTTLVTNMTVPVVWERSTFHFDSFPSAALSLLVVGSGGYWTSIMYDGMDVSDATTGLHLNAHPLYAMYFVAAFIVINMFSLRLTVAILINVFSQASKVRDGSFLLTPQQRQYVLARDTLEALLDKNDDLVPLENGVSLAVHEYFLNRTISPVFGGGGGGGAHARPVKIFDNVVRAVALINCAVVLTYHKDTLPFEFLARDLVDLIALGVYTVEVVARITAYGLQQYASVLWNWVDCAMLPLILVGYLFDGTPPLSFFRCVVLLKILKLTPLGGLLWSLTKHAMQYANVMILLMLVYFVYAAAGVILFGSTSTVLPGTSNFANFRNVPSALLVLFGSSTGRGWEAVMTSLATAAPGCVDDGHDGMNQCGSLQPAVAYFATFMIIAVFSVLHLLVAVVVDMFRSHLDPTDPVIAASFEMRELWEKTFGVGQPLADISDFLKLIPEMPVALTGLRFGRHAAFVRFVATLHVEIDDKFRVRFKDVLRAFIWRHFKIAADSVPLVFHEPPVSSHRQGSRVQSRDGSALRTAPSFTVGDALAARIIQSRYSEWKARRQEAHRSRLLALRRRVARRGGDDDEYGGSCADDGIAEDDVVTKRRASIARRQSYSEDLMAMVMSVSRVNVVDQGQASGSAVIATSGSSGSEGRVHRPPTVALGVRTLPAAAVVVPDTELFVFPHAPSTNP